MEKFEKLEEEKVEIDIEGKKDEKDKDQDKLSDLVE